MELKEKYRLGEEFLLEKEKEFIEQAHKKDMKLLELEQALKQVSGEYEYEIVNLNKLLTEKENELLESNRYTSLAGINLEKQINEANLIIQDFKSKQDFYSTQNMELERLCSENKLLIFSLESENKIANENLSKKELIINNLEHKININNEKIIELENLNCELSDKLSCLTMKNTNANVSYNYKYSSTDSGGYNSHNLKNEHVDYKKPQEDELTFNSKIREKGKIYKINKIL